MRSRSRHRRLGLLWFVFVLSLLTGLIAFSYVLTGVLYRVLGWHLAPVLMQIVNSFLGLIFTGLAVSGVVKMGASRGLSPEMNVFAPIIDALEKIAQGDFSIRVGEQFRDNEIVGKLASSVNKMALELDQLENLRQEFISNVSHEIQSPLTSIRGFAQALEDDGLSADQRHHYLSIIENESTRLSRITQDLLRLAALDSEHARFEPKRYRLDQQIRSLILVCEPQWSAKRLDMQVSLDPMEVTADDDLLSQAWSNLLHNSIKFTPPSGTVCIDLHSRAGLIEFHIADSGIGIPVEDLPHVFERFYKADRSRTRSTEGSGLGLSIAKKIIEMHRGSISVESRPGSGASFTVVLPAG